MAQAAQRRPQPQARQAQIRQSQGLRRLSEIAEGRRMRWLLPSLVVLLTVTSLILPPIAIPTRLVYAGYQLIPQSGGTVTLADGAKLIIPNGSLSSPVRARFGSVTREQFLAAGAGGLTTAAQAVPASLTVKSPIYTLSIIGTAPGVISVTLPLPSDALPTETLDLFRWTGREWLWQASRSNPDVGMVETQLPSVPGALALMQVSAQQSSATADLTANGTVPTAARSALAEVDLAGFYLTGEGDIQSPARLPTAATSPLTATQSLTTPFALTSTFGITSPLGITSTQAITQVPAAAFVYVPSVRNYGDDGIVRSDLLHNLLASKAWQDRQGNALLNLAISGGYPGIDLDYRGLEPTLRVEFTAFVSDLSKRLHQVNKTLSLRVDPPARSAADEWDSGGYDYQALGEVVDRLRIRSSPNPRAFGAGGEMAPILSWAVGQVVRDNLEVVVYARSLDETPAGTYLKDYNEARAPLPGGRLPSTIPPPNGQAVTLNFAGQAAAGALGYEPSLNQYYYRYKDTAGIDHTVWVETAASLSRKLRLLGRYRLRGVVVEALAAGGTADEQIWPILRQFQDNADALPE